METLWQVKHQVCWWLSTVVTALFRASRLRLPLWLTHESEFSWHLKWQPSPSSSGTLLRERAGDVLKWVWWRQRSAPAVERLVAAYTIWAAKSTCALFKLEIHCFFSISLGFLCSGTPVSAHHNNYHHIIKVVWNNTIQLAMAHDPPPGPITDRQNLAWTLLYSF